MFILFMNLCMCLYVICDCMNLYANYNYMWTACIELYVILE
jgi:hypothetical protein